MEAAWNLSAADTYHKRQKIKRYPNCCSTMKRHVQQYRELWDAAEVGDTNVTDVSIDRELDIDETSQFEDY